MTTLTTVEQHQALENLIELYLTSCRIEGKSDETVRSYRESLETFLQALRDEGLPHDPQSFTAAAFGVAPGAIMEANGMADASTIYAGREVAIRGATLDSRGRRRISSVEAALSAVAQRLPPTGARCKHKAGVKHEAML